MKEIWKDISGFEGKYQVSTLGRVKSLTRKVNSIHGPESKTIKERILKHDISKMQYHRVILSKNLYRYSVHRLVGFAFIPKPDNKPCINHKDGDRHNNNVSNLEWCTHQENERHSWDVLGKKQHLNTTGFVPINAKPVIQFDLNGNKIAKYLTANDAAAALNILPSLIQTVCRGVRKSSHGFKFKYLKGANKMFKRTSKLGEPIKIYKSRASLLN